MGGQGKRHENSRGRWVCEGQAGLVSVSARRDGGRGGIGEETEGDFIVKTYEWRRL
jgi:hypothetical protein